LDEWSSGIQIKKNFTESDDKAVYNKHLKRLNDWESVDPVVTKNLHTKLVKRLMYVLALSTIFLIFILLFRKWAKAVDICKQGDVAGLGAAAIE
jgi:predicted RND superfamily exporter protein